MGSFGLISVLILKSTLLVQGYQNIPFVSKSIAYTFNHSLSMTAPRKVRLKVLFLVSELLC